MGKWGGVGAGGALGDMSGSKRQPIKSNERETIGGIFRIRGIPASGAKKKNGGF